MSPGITRALAYHRLDSMGYRYSHDSAKSSLRTFRRVDSTSIVYADVELDLAFTPDGRLERRAARLHLTGP